MHVKATKSQNTDRSSRGHNIARRLNKHTKSKICGVANNEDKPQTRCHHQLDSAAAKQIKRSSSILGLSHTYKNNTSQRLQRRTVDCCLEAGKLIASIAVRGWAPPCLRFLIVGLWKSADPSHWLSPSVNIHLAPVTDALRQSGSTIQKERKRKEQHLDLCNVSISGWEFHQRSVRRWFQPSHSDDEASPIAELMCGERVKSVH